MLLLQQKRLYSFLYYLAATSGTTRASFLKKTGFLAAFASSAMAFSISANTGSKAAAESQRPALLRILVHGGDNMLGRAVQLTFPTQAPGESLIQDSCTAQYYLNMCLDHPSTISGQQGQSQSALGVEDIRKLNAQHGKYLWGDYLNLKVQNPIPHFRLLNLETAVTKSIRNNDIPFYKGINYHMHSDNYETIMRGFVEQQKQHSSPAPKLSPVVVNCANNHGIDYGRRALEQETLPLFRRLNANASKGLPLHTIGLGSNFEEASKPASVACELSDGTTPTSKEVPVQVFAFSAGCSGTPEDWFASDTKSGLVGLPGIYSSRQVDEAMRIVQRAIRLHENEHPKKQSRDAIEGREQQQRRPIRIISIHWGPNWAMKSETREQVEARRQLAHRLIDECDVDLIYGHSSHHARGIELYRDKLVLYGAGDIINDYEGFENPGEEQYNRLGGIYVVDVDPLSGNFRQLRVVPMFMNRLQLRRATTESALWRPQHRRLEPMIAGDGSRTDNNKIRDFGRFVNQMSRIDATSTADNSDDAKDGRGGTPLELEYVEFDECVPGGPILRSKSAYQAE